MHAKATTLFTLPPEAFSPPPEVHSSVIRLEFAPRFAELGVDASGFNRFLRAGFAQKRKTLQNNLRAAGFSVEKIKTAWPPNLPAQVRAEAVSLEDMAALYGSLGSPSIEATEPGS
jgi:16S rRNA (adenine1518-N6/adenine1519-N6)-dimethyltransferase